MMKTYAIRKKLRTHVQCQFCYFCDGALANGIVWDLSEAGWRSTGEHPIPVGSETTVYITLSNGNKILIDTAVVRWSEGREAGWEITRMDEASRARLMDFIGQFKAADVTSKTSDKVRRY